MGHHRILPTPQRAHLPTSYQKAVLPSASPLPLPCALCTKPEVACHPRGLASPFAGSRPQQGLSLPWPPCSLEGLQPYGAAPSTANPLEEARSPEKLEQAQSSCAKSASIARQSF